MKSIVVCFFVFLHSGIESSVIPPPWADERINPCAKYSWQYLFWQADGQCYPIFRQGPCSPTQELVFDAADKSVKCQCPSDQVEWQDGRCYEPFMQGPCPKNTFLHPGKEIQQRPQRLEPNRRVLLQMQAWLNPVESHRGDQQLGFAHCKERGYCPSNWAFWPATELCYRLNSQGPCHNGNIFYWNAKNGQAECGCSQEELQQYFWPVSATCHEHYSQGPCPMGHIFSYNYSKETTQCSCTRHSNNYHDKTEKCYEKFSRGPCNQGQWLTSHSEDLPEYPVAASSRWQVSDLDLDVIPKKKRTGLICLCLPGHLYSAKDNHCYRQFTQGPCKASSIFVMDTMAKGGGTKPGICIKNPCSRHELYFPELLKCFKSHSKGPCAHGQVVVSDDVHTISYRGRCGCSPANVQYYWPEDSKCYEHETRGPCTHEDFVVNIRTGNGINPECSCPENHVLFNVTGKCYRPFSQGPCEWNEWFVPKYQANNNLASTADNHSNYLDLIGYGCQCKPGYEYQLGSNYCQPPSVELLLSLGKSGDRKEPPLKNGQRRFTVYQQP